MKHVMLPSVDNVNHPSLYGGRVFTSTENQKSEARNSWMGTTDEVRPSKTTTNGMGKTLSMRASFGWGLTG